LSLDILFIAEKASRFSVYVKGALRWVRLAGGSWYREERSKFQEGIETVPSRLE
jgi:5-methylthioribose kinase